MLLTCRIQSKALFRRFTLVTQLWVCLLIVLLLARNAYGMTSGEMQALRRETEQLFYHGFNNYMQFAFPEDEIRPISCKPLFRDVANPAHIELNDPLGNYSLTLIDSLSTLAILASSSGSVERNKRSLKTFQNSIAALIDQYGDGSEGPDGQGKRSRGFDLDSKIQVFETVIRGVGGLLSAHLFAIGELPIKGYEPKKALQIDRHGVEEIKWSRHFTYNGQLLRLALDLGKRLLPAFTTSTGIPYPRVNLRHGVPFYKSSPVNSLEDEICQGSDIGQCPASSHSTYEVTETCSAGAGSLVLEFTVLSRLTGDPRFEQLAKRAFWSIWERRSSVGLIGAGIDAESGLWTSPYTGIGAGIDSFFEYAAKAHVLLSGSDLPDPAATFELPIFDYSTPLTAEHHDPESFLKVWDDAHNAIKRHLYRGSSYIHPHYIQADLYTGASRALWVDSLSAFFPGLLTLTGEVDEAIETHLLFTALWTRYSALPERWSTLTGSVESSLGWWGGRPEFIESTYYIYRATHDPWYLHVGEMTLRDIKRRCWAKCGWSGIQDVRTGERNDRMESFFLGETAKYLHLLFDPDHPFNKLDAPFVFTTEGHPLIIPKSMRRSKRLTETSVDIRMKTSKPNKHTCPKSSRLVPFTMSATATRTDLFHAANLARLQHMPTFEDLDSPIIKFSTDHPSISLSDIRSPSNYTYFPWTLPLELIPHDATCSRITPRPTFDITFPALPNIILTPGLLQRVGNGILINGMAGLRLGMIQDVPATQSRNKDKDMYRVHAINNIPLGKDEKIFLAKDVLANVVNALDPNFTRVRDPVMLDIVVDTAMPKEPEVKPDPPKHQSLNGTQLPKQTTSDADVPREPTSQMKHALGNFMQQFSSKMRDPPPSPSLNTPLVRSYLSAITSTGAGAAPLPDIPEALGLDLTGAPQGDLLWHTVFAAGHNCDKSLSINVPRNHQIIVLKRGRCSFSRKLANIPTYAPSKSSLQLVLIVSYEGDDGDWLTRPLLDETQFSLGGLPKRNPIPMVMVGGGEHVYEVLRGAVGVGVKRRYTVQAQGVPISNLIII